MEINSQKELMVWLINFMADTFGNSAILKGGMQLCLLDCPSAVQTFSGFHYYYSSGHKRDQSPH